MSTTTAGQTPDNSDVAPTLQIGGEINMSTKPDKSEGTMTPTELAAELGMDPKTLRRIMRSMTTKDVQPGSGGRWELDADAIAAIRERVSKSHSRKVVTFRPNMPTE